MSIQFANVWDRFRMTKAILSELVNNNTQKNKHSTWSLAMHRSEFY